ncbi:MAG: ribosomal-processing cysteine protease Prp [Treponema sp.]|nr:ribosomal-processing cysteine protease Prp [Treponema sp.]
MTEVLLVCRCGEFVSIKAEGHASFAAKGKDIVCAAESVLLGTALEVLEQTEDIKVESSAGKRGKLEFSAHVVNGSENSKVLSERLKCTADFLRNGFLSISRQFPENVHFQEITED